MRLLSHQAVHRLQALDAITLRPFHHCIIEYYMDLAPADFIVDADDNVDGTNRIPIRFLWRQWMLQVTCASLLLQWKVLKMCCCSLMMRMVARV